MRNIIVLTLLAVMAFSSQAAFSKPLRDKNCIEVVNDKGVPKKVCKHILF